MRADLCGIDSFRSDDGYGFAKEFGFIHRQQRPVHDRRTKTRDRLGQIRSRDHAVNAFHLQGVADIDGLDASVTAIQMDQFEMQHILEAQVGRIALRPGDAFHAAHTNRRFASEAVVLHSFASEAATTASIMR